MPYIFFCFIVSIYFTLYWITSTWFFSGPTILTRNKKLHFENYTFFTNKWFLPLETFNKTIFSNKAKYFTFLYFVCSEKIYCFKFSVLIVSRYVNYFQVTPSRIFRREGADVHSDVTITLSQAVLGGTKRVPGIYDDILLNVRFESLSNVDLDVHFIILLKNITLWPILKKWKTKWIQTKFMF